MTNRLNMYREAAKGIGLRAAGESESVTLGQIVLDAPVKGSRTHGVLPGHGRATLMSFRLSSLA